MLEGVFDGGIFCPGGTGCTELFHCRNAAYGLE
jgi:hypothetical protein